MIIVEWNGIILGRQRFDRVNSKKIGSGRKSFGKIGATDRKLSGIRIITWERGANSSRVVTNSGYESRTFNSVWCTARPYVTLTSIRLIDNESEIEIDRRDIGRSKSIDLKITHS